VYVLPVAIAEPPVEDVYHEIVPAVAEAPKATAPAPHLLDGDVPVMSGTRFNVIAIVLLFAVEDETQLAFEVIVTLI
jgi:hypothetical protein